MNSFALLALDTSAEYCSVALCMPLGIATARAPSPSSPSAAAPAATLVAAVACADDAGAGLRYWSLDLSTGPQSSGSILPAVAAVLQVAGVALSDCGAIAFGAGPGSFTGLRTAAGVAQGLAYGAGLPVVPVNMLMACAEAARRNGCFDGRWPNAADVKVLVAVDARMDECYWQAFEWPVDAVEWQSPGAGVDKNDKNDARAATSLANDHGRVGPAEAVVSAWAPEVPFAVVGNASRVYGERLAVAARAEVCVDTVRADAAAVAGVGWRAWQAGRTVPAAQAMPRYIRDKVALTTEERARLRAKPDAAASAAETLR